MPSGHRSYRVVVLLAALAACTAPSTVQRFRERHGEFAARATSYAPITATAAWLPEGTIHNEPGELELTQAVLDATVPLPRSDDAFAIVGALAGARHYDFDGVPVLEDDTLHRYGVRLGYGAFVDDDLLLQGYWQPSVYSDLDGTMRSEDYRLWYGTFLAVYRASPDLFWKGGAIATDAADTGVAPLAGVTWHFAAPWSLQVLLPRNADLVYDAGGWAAYAGFLLESDEYHVRSPDALGLEDDVHVQELLAHVTLEWRFDGPSVLLRAGSTVAGHYDYGYGNGTDDLTGTLEPDWFVSAGVGWRF